MSSVDITPTKGFPHMYDFIGDKVTGGSPVVLIVLTFVIIIYYILFSYLGVSVTGVSGQAPPTSPGITFLEIVMWGMFMFLVLIQLQYSNLKLRIFLFLMIFFLTLIYCIESPISLAYRG